MILDLYNQLEFIVTWSMSIKNQRTFDSPNRDSNYYVNYSAENGTVCVAETNIIQAGTTRGGSTGKGTSRERKANRRWSS